MMAHLHEEIPVILELHQMTIGRIAPPSTPLSSFSYIDSMVLFRPIESLAGPPPQDCSIFPWTSNSRTGGVARQLIEHEASERS